MAQQEPTTKNSSAPGNGDRVEVITCLLFSDQVTIEVCTVRRMELDERGGFSCAGCPAAAQRDRFGATPSVKQLP